MLKNAYNAVPGPTRLRGGKGEKGNGGRGGGKMEKSDVGRVVNGPGEHKGWKKPM